MDPNKILELIEKKKYQKGRNNVPKTRNAKKYQKLTKSTMNGEKVPKV